MRRVWIPLSLVVLMLTMPWSSVSFEVGENDGLSGINESHWTASEAAENWFEVTATPGRQVPISQGSGKLWVQTGQFDPLIDTTNIPSNLFAADDAFATGYLLMQLNSNDGDLALALADEVSATIVDTLPEDAWILRLPTGAQERAISITKLSDDDRVRWVGSQHPAWRLDYSLHNVPVEQKIDLDLTPSPDLSDVEIQQLENDLIAAGAEPVRCDMWLCQVFNLSTNLLPALAKDHRLLFTEQHLEIEIVNNYARSLSKIDAVNNNHNGGLDGTGEVGALSDSGLDHDHGDFGTRSVGIHHTYGPDNSAADTNSGHGTHVSAIMLGDGSGDSSTKGVAPGATFHFYQLEHDQSGSLARWGSLYDMFRDARQKSAHVQSNSWGAQTSWGQYTSDSRSADSFLHDYDDFLVLFAAGNEGSQGSSSIPPPGTSKNVLTVGASTTGRPGTAASGQIASFSSLGPTADGRIKPDIVAPGVQICSARALEAQSPAGWSCSSARHSGTNTPLYMSADGTSASTPVVGGAALLARQFLRQEMGISNPDSALIKAVLINGAKDLGTANIPNMDEGWGQLDLEESLYPQSGIIAKSIFYDSSQVLTAGHSYAYTYALDGSYGIDVTLVWNDKEGSASGSQSSTRLVNDLDLTVTAPDGTVYKGNDFANGLSTTGGSKDSLNNVERVRLDNGATGDWQISVSHAGGSSQGYAVVLSAVGNENPMSDLAIYEGSVWASQVTPLENDYVLLRMAWVNQAPAMTEPYEVIVEDVTENEILWSGTRSALGGGEGDTFSFQKRFTTTGIHTIRLSLDTTNNVTEMNDEVDGTNNNIGTLDINVTAIGVRITPHNEDGSLPDASELEGAHRRVLDPSTGSDVSWDLTVANEGTSVEQIELVVTPVQRLRENGALDPALQWEKFPGGFDVFTLDQSGGPSDTNVLSLTLRDTDADFNALNGPAYALPGTYVVDVTAFYRANPTVSHIIRLEIEVLRIEGLETVIAGDVDLGALPGEHAPFSITIQNSGNGPTIYEMSCETPNRWKIELGSGNSSSLILEPLARKQFMPVQVRVFVPGISNGLPAAGTEEGVTCVVSSQADPTKSSTESAVVKVLESRQFSVDLYDGDGNPLGPAATIEDILALNGDSIEHTLEIMNKGNVEISLTVRASPAQATWAMQLTSDAVSDDRVLALTLAPGATKVVDVLILVPENAARLDSNQVNFRIERSSSEFITNRTKILVQESADFEITVPDSGTISANIGDMSSAVISLKNTGNVDLSMTMSFGTLPDGWTAGFLSVPPTTLAKGGQASVTVYVSVAPNTAYASIPIASLILLVDAETADGLAIQKTGELGVMIESSVWVDLQHDVGLQVGISEGEILEGNLTIHNKGNSPCSVSLTVEGPDGLGFELDRIEWNLLEQDSSTTVPFTLTGEENHKGVKSIWINATVISSDGANVISTGTILNVTSAGGGDAGGLLGTLESLGLSPWVAVTIAFAFVALLGIGMMRLRRQTSGISRGEELISPGEIIGNQEIRRAAALDIGVASDDQTSGTVSEAEIAAALAQSAPAPIGLPPLPLGGVPAGLPPGSDPLPAGLPPALPVQTAPPLPPGGLPPGWTMEQWTHYGQEYLERTGQA